VNGYVKQYVEAIRGNRITSGLLNRRFCGLSAVFSKNTFNYSAVALTDCLAFLIEKDVIGKVIRRMACSASVLSSDIASKTPICLKPSGMCFTNK
jgi:CRP-like cAMP-binding protein